MNNQYDTEWTREVAAQYLADLCGISISYFSYPGRATDKGTYNRRELLQNCTYLNFFRGDESGRWGEDLKNRTLVEYSGKSWGKRYKVFNDWFFKNKYKSRSLYSPLHGREIFVLGGFLLNRFQVVACYDGSKLAFLFMLGKTAYAIYYPEVNLFLNLDSYVENNAGILNSFLLWFLSHPREFAAWVMLAKSGRLKRAFIIGDNRPGHYIKQSLAFIDAELHRCILPFIEKGGVVAVVRDWCFIDFASLFPELRAANTLLFNSSDAAALMLSLSLDVHRVYRYSTHSDPQWLRDRLGVCKVRDSQGGDLISEVESDLAKRDHFKVLLSIDAEKRRVINQVEVFRFVLLRLADACSAKGISLEVVWDGWTVAHKPSEKDIRVIGEIENIISEVVSGLSLSLIQTKIFGMNVEAKIPHVEGCGLVMVTQGTGAVIPCWLLQCPTITYHVQEIVGDRSCLDEDFAYNIPQRAILPLPGDTAKVPHEKRFSIALWGVESALIDAVGEYLPLHPSLECPIPQ